MKTCSDTLNQSDTSNKTALAGNIRHFSGTLVLAAVLLLGVAVGCKKQEERQAGGGADSSAGAPAGAEAPAPGAAQGAATPTPTPAAAAH